MRKLFKVRKLFKGGNYMRKYGMYISYLRHSNKSLALTTACSKMNSNFSGSKISLKQSYLLKKSYKSSNGNSEIQLSTEYLFSVQ